MSANDFVGPQMECLGYPSVTPIHGVHCKWDADSSVKKQKKRRDSAA